MREGPSGDLISCCLELYRPKTVFGMGLGNQLGASEVVFEAARYILSCLPQLTSWQLRSVPVVIPNNSSEAALHRERYRNEIWMSQRHKLPWQGL